VTAGAFVLLTLAAVLAAASSNLSSTGRVLRSWALYAVGLAGLALLGAVLGLVMRSALCASMWYAQCG